MTAFHIRIDPVSSPTEFTLVVDWDFDLGTGNPAKTVLRALLEQPYGINRVELHRYNAHLIGLLRVAHSWNAATDLAELLVEDQELPALLGTAYEVWVGNSRIYRRT